MSLFTKKCFNGGNKHNFKPRYSNCFGEVGKGVVSRIESMKGDYFSSLKEDVYERDVCTWCGKTIEK